jgi:hypothetical protein
LTRTVSDLFSNIKENAFHNPRGWRTALDEKFHGFAGNYNEIKAREPYRFVNDGTTGMEMTLSPPQVTAQPMFFLKEGYAKHLIGLAYSVVVAEHFLMGLQKVFKKQHYDDYNYRYPWESEEAPDPAENGEDDDSLFDDEEEDDDDGAYI